MCGKLNLEAILIVVSEIEEFEQGEDPQRPINLRGSVVRLCNPLLSLGGSAARFSSSTIDIRKTQPVKVSISMNTTNSEVRS